MTREQWKERLPVIQAWVEGKTIQFQFQVQGITNYYWFDLEANSPPNFGEQHLRWRIKPEPKLRPWKPEEVPVGSLIRQLKRDSEHNRYMLSSVNGDSIHWGQYGYTSLSEALNVCEYSPDHGKTWLPCGVEE